MDKNIELIKKLMNERGMTQIELAKKTGITQSSLSDYINNKYKPKQDKLDKIAKALGVSPAVFWKDSLNEVKESEASYKVTKGIPVIGTIAAGTPLLAEENIEDYFILDSKINADFALNIKGDSMIDAHIEEKDIVFIRKQETLENGEIGAILIDNEATLKRFYKDNGTITLISENEKYPPMNYTNGDIRVLGKLVAVLNFRN
jgi:repressor LexA